MQNRYAGDIGDFIKLGLLRALSGGKRLGVNWYLYPDEYHNGDGGYTSYLLDPARWRVSDPELFDNLKGMVSAGRSVQALHTSLANETRFLTNLFRLAGQQTGVVKVPARVV
ncbi:hypothetical protein ACVOMV_12900 [Mesorhizobium atlanticum]